MAEKKIQRVASPALAAQTSQLAKKLKQCSPAGDHVSDPIPEVPVGTDYEKQVAKYGKHLQLLREVAIARFYQINMLKRDILKREKMSMAIRAEAEMKRLDLDYKMDVRKDLKAISPYGPEHSLPCNVSVTMLETLEQTVHYLKHIHATREKQLKIKLDQLESLIRSPKVAKVVCMKAELADLKKKLATLTEKTDAMEEMAKRLKMQVLGILRKWNRSMQETDESLKVCEALMERVLREGTEKGSQLYTEGFKLLREAAVHDPGKAIREEVMTSMEEFRTSLRNLQALCDEFDDIPPVNLDPS